MPRTTTVALSILAVVTWLSAIVGGALFAFGSGVREGVVVVAASAVAAATMLVAQRVHACRDVWRAWPRMLGVDLLHAAFSTAGVGALFKAVAIGWLLELGVWASATFGASLWPTAWPIAAQLALALVVGELGIYTFHRGMHESRFGWRVHALHHSSETMSMIAALRNHPFNAALTGFVHVGPLIVLGAPAEVLLGVAVFTSAVGMLQHSNVDLPLGPLNLVLSTPEVHRIHHSTRLAEQKSNYGSNLVIWDLVFGTYVAPRSVPSFEVGIPEFAIPRNWFAHLATPFVLYRWLLDEDPEALDPAPAGADTGS